MTRARAGSNGCQSQEADQSAALEHHMTSRHGVFVSSEIKGEYMSEI